MCCVNNTYRFACVQSFLRSFTYAWTRAATNATMATGIRRSRLRFRNPAQNSNMYSSGVGTIPSELLANSVYSHLLKSCQYKVRLAMRAETSAVSSYQSTHLVIVAKIFLDIVVSSCIFGGLSPPINLFSKSNKKFLL